VGAGVWACIAIIDPRTNTADVRSFMITTLNQSIPYGKRVTGPPQGFSGL
jgi:hypothetical protein